VFCANTTTLNHALFVRDSWSILPNLTLNLGLRWERQALQGIKDYEDVILGDSPIVLNNNWAPRLGVIYDPTNEGKAKIYGSFARFYESVPLDINVRSLGVQSVYQNIYRLSGCTNPLSPWNRAMAQPPMSGGVDCGASIDSVLFAGEKSLVEPDIKGMYSDEWVLGGEYEILEDLAIGAYYTKRYLGPVIEDGSVDNATTYYIANPGEPVERSQIQTLQNQAIAARKIADQPGTDPLLRGQLQHLANSLDAFADDLPNFAKFDKPRRDYDAISITARKRFSKNWLAQASYTYARTIGNYPGLFNPVNGQIDPNISTQFDLPDLLHNRNGPLPQDTPHQLKLDGYYTWRFKGGDHQLITGSSFRVHSGSPRNYTAWSAHAGYDANESFILPAGMAGRNDLFYSWDLQLQYVRQLRHNRQFMVFFSVYNLLDTQTALLRDDQYTAADVRVNPVVNGTTGELAHLKDINGAVARQNENFGRPVAYQAPIFTRFGARFTF
jgi:hypothetical protein